MNSSESDIQTIKSKADWLYYTKQYDKALETYQSLYDKLKQSKKPKKNQLCEIIESIAFCNFKLGNDVTAIQLLKQIVIN